MAAVLNNAERLEEIYQTAEGSAGSAMREQEKYTESIQYSIDQLTAQIEEFWAALIRTDDVKNFLNILNGIVWVGTQIVDVFGAVPILVGIIAGVIVAACVTIGRGADGLIIKFSILNALTAGLPVLIGLLTTVGVGLISWAFTAFDTSKRIEDLTNKIEEQQEAIDELHQKEKDVTDLYEEYNALMTKSNAFGLNASEKESLLKISKDLVETYGLEVSGIDAITGAYIIGADAVNNYTEALRLERIEKEREQNNTRNKRIDEYVKQAKDIKYRLDLYKQASANYHQFQDLIDKYNEDVAKGEEPLVYISDRLWNEMQRRGEQLGIDWGVYNLIYTDAVGGEQVDSQISILQGQLANKANLIAQDIVTNIKVANAGLLNSNSESFISQLITPYLSSGDIDWSTFNTQAFQDQVANFIAGNKGYIDQLIADMNKTSTALSSDKVSVDDYKKYIENEMKKASMVAAMIGGEEGKKQGQLILDNLAKNFGAKLAQISTKIGDKSGVFDTFATKLLQLEKQLLSGEKTFSEYIDSINSSVSNLDIEKTFGDNAEAIAMFFESLNTKGQDALKNVVAEFEAGHISMEEYLNNVEDLGRYFTNLAKKVSSIPGLDPNVSKSLTESSNKITALIEELNSLQSIAEIAALSFEEFEKQPISSIDALVNKLLSLGVTAKDLGLDAQASAEEIATALRTKTETFARMQEAVAAKTQSVLAKIGSAIGSIIGGLSTYISNFKVEFVPNFNWSTMKFSLEAKASGSPYQPTSTEWKNYADAYAGIIRNEEGGTVNWTRERQNLWNEASHHTADQIFWGNLLSNAFKDFDFSSYYDIPDTTGGDVPDDGGSSGSGSENFDDNYYSLVSAWLADGEKEIEKLQREREDLNRKFENALESGNKEQAEILRSKLGENAKTQKDILHGQNEAHRITKETLLQSLYRVIPELNGKSWEEISEVDLTSIENSLSREIEMAGDNEAQKNAASLKLNTFKGIVEDINAVDDAIKENSASWWDLDEESKSNWQSQIDFQDEYSKEWIDNQKAFGKLSEAQELAAYDRMINNNKSFQEQILQDTSLSEEAKLALIKDTNDKIIDIEKNAYSLRSSIFNKAGSYGNTYLESKKTLLQSHFDVTNSIAEAQHEINKELETSMTMYGYLDEETRKLLFNQEDYNELCEALNNIEDESLRLKSKYEQAINNATLDTIESITSEYQMQYETLMKSYEIAKADLEIAKKKAKLNNVLNERNVRMFINGSWQWVANTEDVANAKAELADAEYAKRVEESGLAQQESINNLTRQQNELGVVISKFENGVITLDEAVRLASQAIGSMPNALYSMLSNSASSIAQSTFTSVKGASGGLSMYSGVGYDSGTNYMTKILESTNKMDVVEYNNARNAKIAGENSSEKQLTSSEAIALWEEANKHADGTPYTPGGLTIMGEEGFEAFVSSKGRLIPITQPTIGNISSGGVVFNADQMKNLRTLWGLSNYNLNGNSNFISSAQPQTIDQSQDNRIIINGMTVDSGSADGQALISALRRYVGNH